MTEIVLRAAVPEPPAVLTDLIWNTAASLYGYVFTSREVFDAFVECSWSMRDSSYGYSAATLAFRGDELLGIELGFKGPEYYAAGGRMRDVARELVESGRVDLPTLKRVGERTRHASFVSPHLPQAVYYVTSLSVTSAAQGRGVGAMLLDDAARRAREAGFRHLELDVMSDNPAVGFYERQGLVCMAETHSPALQGAGVPPQRRMAIDL